MDSTDLIHLKVSTGLIMDKLIGNIWHQKLKEDTNNSNQVDIVTDRHVFCDNCMNCSCTYLFCRMLSINKILRYIVFYSNYLQDFDSKKKKFNQETIFSLVMLCLRFLEKTWKSYTGSETNFWIEIQFISINNNFHKKISNCWNCQQKIKWRRL